MRRRAWNCVVLTSVVILAVACRQRASSQALEPVSVKPRIRATDGMVMVYVPGGEFSMGRGLVGESRSHRVQLDAFWIDRTEVTNAQYRRCVEAGSCRAPTACSWGEPTYDDASKVDHPVVCVSRLAARAYCDWAGGRLPNEAEWEYAARGPGGAVYPWGDRLDGTRLNACDARCPHDDHRDPAYDDGYERTAPVGSYPSGASWCGALDMAGNVWEWVSDWYAPYAPGRQANPTGPSRGDEGIIRGGSWFDFDEYGFLRADNRHAYEPQASNDLTGFRCAVPQAD